MTSKNREGLVNPQEQKKPTDFLPLKPTTVLVMLSVIDTPKHGYAIRQRISEITEGNVTMPFGTLYENLQWQSVNGLLETKDAERKRGGAQKTTDYKLSDFGREVLIAERDRIAKLKEMIDNSIT